MAKHILDKTRIGNGWLIEYWNDEEDYVCRHSVKYRKIESGIK